MRFYLIIVTFLLLGCHHVRNEADSNDIKIEVDVHIFVNTFDRFKEEYNQNKLETILNERWLDENIDVIRQKNANFKPEDLQKSELIIIPSLNIPTNKIEINQINLSHYFGFANFSYKFCNVLIIKDSVLLGIVDHSYLGLSPRTFTDLVNKAKINELRDADFYFKLNFVREDGLSYSPMPGIIYFKDSEFFVLSEYGDIYPLNQIHKLLWETPKQFQRHLNAIKRLN